MCSCMYIGVAKIQQRKNLSILDLGEVHFYETSVIENMAGIMVTNEFVVDTGDDR